MADIIRERQIAARKALKGDKAQAPTATIAKQQKTLTLSGPSAEDEQAGRAARGVSDEKDPLQEFLKKTRMDRDEDLNVENPCAMIPFNRLDIILFLMLALAGYYYVLTHHKVDLVPHIWYYIRPHYDHDDERPLMPHDEEWSPSGGDERGAASFDL